YFPSDDLPWDGTDADGRVPQGFIPVHIYVNYDYQAQLFSSKNDFDHSFGVYGRATSAAGGGGQISISPARQSAVVRFAQGFDMFMGELDSRGTGIGGWTIDAHHTYHPTARTLFLGNGDVRTPGVAGAMIDTFWGAARNPRGLAVDPDG